MELAVLVVLAGAIALALGALVRIVAAARAPVHSDAQLAEDGDAARLGDLAERKEMVMQLILSTELDHQTHKISDEDRDKTLARLKREAVGLMKEMDTLAGDQVDTERADQELDAFLARSRAAGGDRQWSAAARLRHGGAHPTGDAT